MDIFLNFGFAWISVLLVLILSIVYGLRMVIKKNPKKYMFIKNLNKKLRKHHKIIGIILIATGLVHGLYSSVTVISLNLGTAAWVLSILLGLSFMFRKSLSKYKGWMHYHRVLTVGFILLIVIHVVQVGGIQVFNYIGSNSNTTNITNSIGVTTTGSTYKDGIFTGTATGFRPGMKVSVTIKGNKITDIKIVKSNDTSNFLNRAKGIISTIIGKQSTSVDSVSGATYSSNGIKKAVNSALAQALVK